MRCRRGAKRGAQRAVRVVQRRAAAVAELHHARRRAGSRFLRLGLRFTGLRRRRRSLGLRDRFRAGADDYLSKPFNMEELQLRVQAILRRVQAPEEEEEEEEPLLVVGDVVLDCRTFKVTTPTDTVLLTNVQFDLLYHLMSHADQVFTSQQLLQDVWDYPPDTGSPELVRAHIKNLRDKIEPQSGEPIYIRTIQGHGYTFSAPSAE